ncbi:glutamine ABC transporter ATP-binding protein GlnQ [Ectothiorhodospiraceae bacterium WFHF3C12]|nr:glutamine ABC transporter ATP-binding protein GlnQ [Ectothiorhodospiraceae bacterium WFHF3C12]
MIECRQMTKRFGDHTVLDRIDLTVDAGEVVVIVGASGSGKSTFLRCVNMLERIDEGDLLVDGKSVRQRSTNVRTLRLEAGMVFQQFNLFPHMTARQNVMLGPRKARGYSRAKAGEIADRLLERVGLVDRAGYFPDALSGGQQQRVAIARALAINPKLMMFDEPTSALDPELRGEVLEVMRGLAEEGMTMLIVTHEVHFALEAATRLLFMDDAHIVHDGDPREMFENPPSERFRDFLRHVRE